VATFLEANGRGYCECLWLVCRQLLLLPAPASPYQPPWHPTPPQTHLPPPPTNPCTITLTTAGEADEEKLERLRQMYSDVEDKLEGVDS